MNKMLCELLCNQSKIRDLMKSERGEMKKKKQDKKSIQKTEIDAFYRVQLLTAL